MGLGHLGDPMENTQASTRPYRRDPGAQKIL